MQVEIIEIGRHSYEAFVITDDKVKFGIRAQSFVRPTDEQIIAHFKTNYKGYWIEAEQVKESTVTGTLHASKLLTSGLESPMAL